MAAGGGGAWKVAYADFVTAMMAFFLVMWLVSQDQKIKESIAHYFQGPVGIDLLGERSRRTHAGGLFYNEVNGPVPGYTDRASGRAIGTSPEPPEANSDTMAVADWILEDATIKDRWMKRTQELYNRAREEHPDQRDMVFFDAIVRPQLILEMHAELSAPVLTEMSGLHRELLLNSLSKIDWGAIADECLLRVRSQ